MKIQLNWKKKIQEAIAEKAWKLIVLTNPFVVNISFKNHMKQIRIYNHKTGKYL